MREIATPDKPAVRLPLNGVDTPALFAAIGAVSRHPSLAQFQFRARNKWVSGTCSQTVIESFSGAGGEHTHASEFRYAADRPAVLVGEDRGPTPVEFLPHALASCLTAGIGNIAAARGGTLTSVESRIEGDIDLQGILGLSDAVRNDYQQLRVSFDIAGDVPPEKLREIVDQARARYEYEGSDADGFMTVSGAIRADLARSGVDAHDGPAR